MIANITIFIQDGILAKALDSHRNPALGLRVARFSEDLETIRKAGFNPIAVSQLYFEDTFVFKTKSEAKRAFNLLEKKKPSKVVGWWYGAVDFMKTVADYEADSEDYKVLIHYLKEEKQVE